MAENTNICNPLQYLLEEDGQNTWVVRDIAAPSLNNIIILLLQKDEESRVAIYQTGPKGFQHKADICQDVEWTDSPLLLSSIYVEDCLNTLICTEKQLISYDNAKLTIRESVPLSERPMAICVDRSNIFVSAATTNKITVFNPSFQKESEHKMTCIGMSESLTAIVVTFKNMYACTKNGEAFWYDLNKKEKKIEYRNRRTQKSKANNIALYKGQRIEHRLVLIIWSESEIHVYSSNSGHTLFAIDVNSSKKIRLTMTNQLIAAEANNAAIYDMKKIIDRGIFLSIFVSSTKPEYREDFIGYVLQHSLYETSESPKRQQDKKPRRSETPVAGTFYFKREQLGELYEMYKRSLENYTEIANSMEEKDQAIDELQVQLKDGESKIFGLQKTLDEESHQVEKTNEELNLLRSTNMTLEKKVQDTERKLQQQERKTEEAMNMFGTMQSDLKEVRHENEVLRGKVVNMETEESSVKQELNSKMQTMNELRSTNMTLKKKVQETEKKLQHQERKTEEAMNMFGTMQSDLKEVKNNTSKLLQESKGQATVTSSNKPLMRGFLGPSTRSSVSESSKPSYSRDKLFAGSAGSLSSYDSEERLMRGSTSPRSGSANSLSSYDSEERLMRGSTSPRSGSASSLSSYDSEFGSRESIHTLPEEVPVHKVLEKQKYSRAVNLMSTTKITKGGGLVEIKGTDVSLLVPPGALLEDCEIHIQIITGNLDTGNAVTFASNSAAIVELTPSNFEFQTAVELHLPHCLQLKENFTNESIEVFTSHHDPEDQPRWERETEVKFKLQKETCTLYLKKFCWVTLRVNNEVVQAKRLKIFTVGGKVMDTDSEFTVHVGYFADVPGNGNIFLNENITIGQYKSFWFQKQEQSPLFISLNELTPAEWRHTAKGRPEKISYEDIASSKNRSCEFVLRCITSVRRSGVPYSTFRVYRQHDSTSISFRPKIWDDVSEDEEP